MGKPSLKGTLLLSNRDKATPTRSQKSYNKPYKANKMKKKDTYLYSESTMCVNPIQHELIQIYPIFMTINSIIEHKI